MAGFNNRWGGVSKKPFDDFNLGLHVGDRKAYVLKNRQILKEFIGSNKLAWMEQVHSNKISIVKKPGERKRADGLITNHKNLILMVMVADCIPVLFYDRKQKIIAVAHAGRQGSFQNISGEIIKKMKEEFNCRPENILASLGPSIKKQCYQVEEKITLEFKKRWGEKFLEKNNTLDLPLLNKSQLLIAGVPEENIGLSDICNHCDKNYFSYRRDKKTGRFAGVIMLKK